MSEHTSQYEWDIHFMKESRLWMERSRCLSRQIGAVLVRNNRVIATGYNGPPAGVPHCDHRNDGGSYSAGFVSDRCPRQRMGYKSGEGMEHCVAIHAEINPIMQAAKMGIPSDGGTLYCYCGTPCVNCAKEIINAGIKRIVCLGKAGSSYAPIKDGDTPAKKEYNFPLSEAILGLAGVQLDVVTEDMVGQ